MLEAGQHAIAVILTAVGIVRSAADDVALGAALAVGAAMIVWYAAGFLLPSIRLHPRMGYGWLAGLTALWLGSVALSPEFVWVAFLLWLLAGHLLPAWPAVGYAAVVFVVVALAPVAHDGSTTYAGVVGPLIGGIFALGISRGYLRLLRDAKEREDLVTSLTATQREMADLHDELALTQRHAGAVAERTRLSRDIHDTVAQSVSSIRLLAHATAERTADPAAAATLRQLESLAAEGLRDVRRIVEALAPAELEDGALAAALTRMLDRLRDDAGVETELRVDGGVQTLPAPIEVAFLRTAQSALANVRQHAHASRVVVTLVDDGDLVRLDIVDDGTGFDPNEPVGPAAPGVSDRSSYGLGFMASRLAELGGGLDLESTPGEGTAISAYLPISAIREAS